MINKKLLILGAILPTGLPFLGISCSFSPENHKDTGNSFWYENSYSGAYTKIDYVYDGDTFYIDNKFQDTRSNTFSKQASGYGWSEVPNSVRVVGVDTPEKKGTTGKEHEYALLATQFTEQELHPSHSTVYLSPLPHFAVGERMTANVKYIPYNQKGYNLNATPYEVQSNWKDLSCALIEQGLGRVAYISKQYVGDANPKNRTYFDHLVYLQHQAQKAKKGFWKESKETLELIFPKANQQFY